MLKNKFYAKFLIMIGAVLILSACSNSGNEARLWETPAPVDTNT